MNTQEPRATWSIAEALAVAYQAFGDRFGPDVLDRAFAALTMHHEDTLAAHRAIAPQLGGYISQALSAQGASLVIWMANAQSDPEQADLLLHCGVRWWLARDAMVRLAPGSRVLCVYADGLTEHVSLQLLAQMLHRGAAPETA